MPEATKIHVGDAGVSFVVTIEDADGPVDLSAASSLKFRYRRPDRTTFEVDAEPDTDGSDGAIKYVSTSATFDRAGVWQQQARVTLDGDAKSSELQTFRVYPVIAA